MRRVQRVWALPVPSITIFKDDSSKLKDVCGIRTLRWAGSSRDWNVGRGRQNTEKG